jgi:hypothetical protein
MAHGLGMSNDEWLELRKKIDDSFWVMRVIGKHAFPTETQILITDLQDTHHSRVKTMAYPAAHTSKHHPYYLCSLKV